MGILKNTQKDFGAGMLVDLFCTSLMRLELEITFRLGTTVTRKDFFKGERTNGWKRGQRDVLIRKSYGRFRLCMACL